jgi:hypothetical protein
MEVEDITGSQVVRSGSARRGCDIMQLGGNRSELDYRSIQYCCRRGYVVLFAISAEGEDEQSDHPFIGQAFVCGVAS